MRNLTFSPVEDFGTFLSGRDLGASMREQIVDLTSSGVVSVDLEGVEMMTPSFADEAFGRIATMLDHEVLLVNVPSGIEPLIGLVVSGRQSSTC